MDNLKKIWANNIVFLVIVSLAIIILTEAVFVYGKIINDQNHYFTGLNTIAVIDGPVYLSYVEQVKDGHFLFRDLFNSNDDFAMLYPFWLVVGLAAKIFHMSGPFILRVFRVILIPLFIFSLYKIIDLLLDKPRRQKRLCLLFSLVLSGFGIFLVPVILMLQSDPQIDLVPIDMWAYESNNFMTLRYYPHVILATALIFLVIACFYLAIIKNKNRYAVYSGLFALILFSFHPFQVPLIYGLTLAYILVLFWQEKKINFKYIKKYLLLAFLALPSVIYYLALMYFNKNIYLKAVQNDNYMTSGFFFVISYGLGLILALYYVYYIFKNKKYSQSNVFLLAWFFITILLVYAPFLNFQRRMLGGFCVPLSILAFLCLLLIYEKLKSLPLKARVMLLSLIIFLCSFSTIYVYVQDFRFMREALRNPKFKFADFVYTRKPLKEALEWYKSQSIDSDIILASSQNGNLIPGLTGRKVFLGHPIETVGYKQKIKELNNFYLFNSGDSDKKEFLRANKITFVFYSELEKKMGIFKPEEKDYLQEVFKNDLVSIYQVK